MQSSNPFVRCKSLTTSATPQNGFKASQYPELDLTQSVHNPNLLKKLQQEHQMAPCLAHGRIVQNVCKAPTCTARLLCEVCVNEHLLQFPGHKEHMVLMQNLLDESILIQVENLAKDELKPFKQLDDRYQSVCSSLHSSFEELKEKIIPLIDRAEEKAQQKIKEYFLQPKKPRGWTTLRQEYLTAKEAYLFSSMGVQTDELEKLIGVLNKIKDKQIEEGTELYNIFHVEQTHMDKLISRVQEDLYFFVETLFYNEKAAAKPVVVKLDPAKLFYDRELKANHKKLLNAMTYMPKLHQLATATESGEISIWDATTFALMNSVKVHHDPINALIYSPDENLLISGSKDKSIRLIPINEKGITTDKIEMFKSHTEAVKSLLLLEGEDRFASAGDDADIRIWNFKTKNLDNIINTKGWKPNGDEMVFIRPERWIAAAGSKEVRVYDYVTRELLITQSAMKNMGSLAFMSEKKLLVSQYDDDRLMVWKLDSIKKKLKKEKKVSLPMSAEKPIYFKCYENSDVMVVSMGASKVLVIKISTGEVLKEIETKLVNTTSVKGLDGERRILIGDAGSSLLGVLQY